MACSHVAFSKLWGPGDRERHGQPAGDTATSTPFSAAGMLECGRCLSASPWTDDEHTTNAFR